MAVRSSKGKHESQETGTDEISTPAEKPESGERLEETKTLIAMRPILYLAKQYKAGDRLPVNNQEMVAAWIEAGSAAWQESGKQQSP